MAASVMVASSGPAYSKVNSEIGESAKELTSVERVTRHGSPCVAMQDFERL